MSVPEHSVPARVKTTRRVLICLLFGLGLGGLTWAAREYSRDRISLEQAIELANAGKLNDAASRVRSHLRRFPDHNAAHLLLAQILLKKASPSTKPADHDVLEWAHAALDHLEQVRPEHTGMAVTLHLTRGNALDRLSRLDEAETAWLEALRVDPTAPEAGWNLLNLYYLEWREDDARRLALRLFEVEPDSHDRVMLLLELLRHDARPPAPGSLVRLFEPIVRACPGDLYPPLALGLALTRAGQVEKGINEVRRVAEGYPESVAAWDCLLTCLDETGQIDVMEEELERLPAEVAGSPRLLKHRGRIAQGHRWKEAVDLYRRAQAAEPYNRVIEYRLSRALRHVGLDPEADLIEQRLIRRDVAIQELRPLYDQATATNDLQGPGHAALYQRIAETRERMQLSEEACAWHRLVLRSDPQNQVSRTALARLGSRGNRG
jgi:tetratricopeptide (TPR) repeat protein